jgi:hypothetical protein
MTARMGVSVGRLPQEVLLEEFYRSECSEIIQVGRVRVFEEFLTLFNCSVLTFWSAIKFHREYRTYEYVTIFTIVGLSTIYSAKESSLASEEPSADNFTVSTKLLQPVNGDLCVLNRPCVARG